MIRSQVPTEVPTWIAGLWSDGRSLVVSAVRLGWGFRNESWKVELADGRVLAITRLADAAVADMIIADTALLQPRLEAAGVPVPAIADLARASTRGLLVTEFVAGTPGAEMLGDWDNASLVGSLLGSTWRRLSSVDASGLRRSLRWDDPARLAEASMARIRAVRVPLEAAERRQLVADVLALPELLRDRAPSFVHGDLVPVNMLIGQDRTLAALLDLEDARVGDPLLDAGWFDLIVGFHHPASQPPAWAAFVAAAALDDRDLVTRTLLRILPELRLLEILDEPRSSAEAASHWPRLLRFCLSRRM